MKRLLATCIFTICVFILPSSTAALTISPTKIEVSADPGQTIVGEIELFNEETETKTFFTSYENFEPRGETGSPFFVGGGVGLASWISAQQSLQITPGERVVVPYTITIPNDATPGGYFAAVFFGSQPPATSVGSEVSIGGKVGTLVLLRVNGEVTETGGVIAFSAGVDNGFLFTSVPVPLTYRFSNDGGDRAIPRGEIVITNVFGGHVTTLNANPNEGSVLPNSVRKFELVWGEAPFTQVESGRTFFEIVKHQAANLRLGVYNMELSLSWGQTNQSSKEAIKVFMFPWQLIVVVGLCLFVLYVVLRQYNRFIISRAKKY